MVSAIRRFHCIAVNIFSITGAFILIRGDGGEGGGGGVEGELAPPYTYILPPSD